MIKKGCGCNKQPKIIEEPSIPLLTWEENTPCIELNPEVRIENHPDEEDITEVLVGDELVLKFKDKVYNPMVYSGYGKVFLRKNLQNSMDECSSKVNVLTQDMFEDDNGLLLDNTIFIVQYDYDLLGKFVTLPLNSILLFLGGSFVNGTLIMNHTLVLPLALIYDNFIKCSVTGVYKEGQMFYDHLGLRIWSGALWIYLGTSEQAGISTIIEELQEQVASLVQLLSTATSVNNTQNTQIQDLSSRLSNYSLVGHTHSTGEILGLSSSLNNKINVGGFIGTINGLTLNLGGSITVSGGGGGSTYVLPKASENTLGGIKTGYQGENTPVQVDSLGNAYVAVDSSGNVDYKITNVSINTSTRKLTIQQNNNTNKEVTIPDTPITEATSNEYGGIKLGFQDNAATKEYGVRLSNGKAYVKVPWVAGEGGGGSGDSITMYHQVAFKATTGTAIPTLPTNGTSDLTNGWSAYAPNSDGTKVVWMTQRLITITNEVSDYGDWLTPWIISGRDGEAGVDGDLYEYIYTRSTAENASIPNPNSGRPATGSPANPSYDDFVPEYWFDHPQGISLEYKYEWMAFRKKSDGVWSSFSSPVLWSAYGKRGTDGDGFEYIFYKSDTATPPPSPLPATWTSDANFLNREYIRDVNLTPWWTDDPSDMTVPGSKLWYCVRKKYADNEGDEPIWHAYSAPLLWQYYAVDGSIQYQGLNGEVMRMRGNWSDPELEQDFIPYNNGTVSEDGVKYVDIVQYNGSYYRCTTAAVTNAPANTSTGATNLGWQLFAPSGDAAFEYLLAHSAYISNLTSKQIIVTDTEGRPVGGLIGSDADAIPDILYDDLYSNNSRVIMFAGLLGAGGDVANTAFNVNEKGELRATGAKISGDIIANNLTILQKDEDTGNGYFESSVSAPKYITFDANHKKYEGATAQVNISGTTLYFVNGLFVGTSDSSTQGTSVTLTRGTDYTVEYMYSTEVTGINGSHNIIFYNNGYVTTAPNSMPAMWHLNMVRVTINNTYAYDIQATFEYLDGIHLNKTMSFYIPAGESKTGEFVCKDLPLVTNISHEVASISSAYKY